MSIDCGWFRFFGFPVEAKTANGVIASAAKPQNSVSRLLGMIWTIRDDQL